MTAKEQVRHTLTHAASLLRQSQRELLEIHPLLQESVQFRSLGKLADKVEKLAQQVSEIYTPTQQQR